MNVKMYSAAREATTRARNVASAIQQVQRQINDDNKDISQKVDKDEQIRAKRKAELELFTAKNAASYAPELQLVGTAATAPAAELVPLFNEQNGQAIDWVIGPEAIISWPSVYANLNAQDVLTSAGKNNYQQIAQKCIDAAAISGIVRNGLHQQFFNTNIMNIPAWKTAAQAQTAPI